MEETGIPLSPELYLPCRVNTGIIAAGNAFPAGSKQIINRQSWQELQIQVLTFGVLFWYAMQQSGSDKLRNASARFCSPAFCAVADKFFLCMA